MMMRSNMKKYTEKFGPDHGLVKERVKVSSLLYFKNSLKVYSGYVC